MTKELPFEFKMEVPEIGKTYPLYGMITEILSEEPFVIIINDQIKGTCVIDDLDKINIVKERAFEPAIFITKIEDKMEDGLIIGTIQTIIFGKKQEMSEN